jgi:hypothetical protein
MPWIRELPESAADARALALPMARVRLLRRAVFGLSAAAAASAAAALAA